MAFTGQLGGTLSQLGNILLGGSPPISPFPFGFLPHVLDARTLRVQFDSQVDDSALDPGAYSFLAISGPPPTFLPSVQFIEFYDADQRSVTLTLSDSLTYTAVYSLSIRSVIDVNGNYVTPSAGNFRANVPDPPRAIGAFFSARGEIDIYFDREVGPTSPGAFATIQASTGGSPQPLTRIPWSSPIPANSVRFELNPSMDVASSFSVTYSNIFDVSNNFGTGTVPLANINRGASPYTYASLSVPQIIDAWVDSISNDPHGLNRVIINVYFNCPMNPADIQNIGNWTISSMNGASVSIFAIYNWSSVNKNRAFDATSGYTYFAQLDVRSPLQLTSSQGFNVTVSALSEDLVYNTHPGDYTGSISVLPLVGTPRLLGASVTLASACLRLNGAIGQPDQTSSKVVGPRGNVRSVISATASLQALVIAITDLMDSYLLHINSAVGADHILTDSVDIIQSGELPGPNLPSAIAAINRFRDVFYAHASSTTYHYFADPNSLFILAPYATDYSSALNLTQQLVSLFIQHNANMGIHISAGAQVYSSKLLDSVSVVLPGMQDSSIYTLRCTTQRTFIDVALTDIPPQGVFSFTAPFTGVADPLFVASAIPKTAVTDTDNGVRFEDDSIIIFFSKPVQRVPVSGSNLEISGPGNLLTKQTVWSDDRVLNVGVIGMMQSQYSLDVVGIQDEFGNSIKSA